MVSTLVAAVETAVSGSLTTTLRRGDWAALAVADRVCLRGDECVLSWSSPSTPLMLYGPWRRSSSNKLGLHSNASANIAIVSASTSTPLHGESAVSQGKHSSIETTYLYGLKRVNTGRVRRTNTGETLQQNKYITLNRRFR